MVKISFKGVPYYIDGWLKKNYDLMHKAVRSNWDFIIIVDGTEGGGKSTLAIQGACYLDPDFNLDRVCFSPEEFEKKVIKAQKYQAIIYDEAVTGLYSRETMQFINIALTKLLAQIRQKNLFIFVVVPTFFDLDKYVSMWRARALLHVYTKGFSRGRFQFFSSQKKKELYALGKKYYNYRGVKPNFQGRYTRYNPFLKAYEKLKYESLANRQQAQANPFSQRDRAIKILYTKYGWIQRDIANLFGIDQSSISIILKRLKGL